MTGENNKEDSSPVINTFQPQNMSSNHARTIETGNLPEGTSAGRDLQFAKNMPNMTKRTLTINAVEPGQISGTQTQQVATISKSINYDNGKKGAPQILDSLGRYNEVVSVENLDHEY